MNRLFTFDIKDCHIMVDYDYNLGHNWGQSQLSPDGRYNFVHVAKNASTEVKTALGTWQQSNYNNLKIDPEHLVILRDPTDRWISGIAEFLVGDFSRTGVFNAKLSIDEIETAINTQMFQNLLFDFVIFDGHTLPQCCYLKGLNINDITFFYFDKSVIPRLMNYVGETPVVPNYRNNSLTNAKKQIIINKIRNLLDNDADLQHIIDLHYYADHQLFDHVKFHTE